MRGNFVTDRTGAKNPNYRHGGKGTRLYRIWASMKTRCYNPKATHYSRYGGRGITICDEWRNSFQAFHDWAMLHGYSDKLTIDRIDVNGNYEPGNCRWATIREQSFNRSNNHNFTIVGVTKTLTEWCELHSINYKTVRDRLRRGWIIERALYEPVRGKHDLL